MKYGRKIKIEIAALISLKSRLLSIRIGDAISAFCQSIQATFYPVAGQSYQSQNSQCQNIQHAKIANAK